MNPQRQLLAVADAQRKAEALRESKPASTQFIPPRKREIASLCDWISDNPSFKQSRAYNKLLDAYWEAIGHSCR